MVSIQKTARYLMWYSLIVGTPFIVHAETTIPTNNVSKTALIQEPVVEKSVAEKPKENTWQKCKLLAPQYAKAIFSPTTFSWCARLRITASIAMNLNPQFYIHILKSNGFYEYDSIRLLIDPMLTKAGLNPADITCLKGHSPHWPAAAFGNKVIAYSNAYRMIEQQRQALIAHEIIHLKHNDPLYAKIFMLTATFAVPYTLKLYAKTTKALLTKAKNKLALKEQSAANKALAWLIDKHDAIATSWITSLLLQLILNATYSQWFEKRADIEAAHLYPEHKVAHHLANTYKECQTVQAQAKHSLHDFVDQVYTNPLVKKLLHVWYNLAIKDNGDLNIDVLHPPTSDRIKSLEAIANQQAIVSAQSL